MQHTFKWIAFLSVLIARYSIAGQYNTIIHQLFIYGHRRKIYINKYLYLIVQLFLRHLHLEVNFSRPLSPMHCFLFLQEKTNSTKIPKKANNSKSAILETATRVNSAVPEITSKANITTQKKFGKTHYQYHNSYWSGSSDFRALEKSIQKVSSVQQEYGKEEQPPGKAPLLRNLGGRHSIHWKRTDWLERSAVCRVQHLRQLTPVQLPVI